LIVQVAAAATLAAGLGVGNVARAAEEQPKVDIEWVVVGDPGNAADDAVMLGDRTTGYGAVDYEYEVSKYLVTNTEYAAFLNAVADESDPYLLWFPCMDHSACYGVGSGVARTGAPGDWHYAAQPGRERRPINYVNLFSAMRFANWMNNGQGEASTETGAYDLAGGQLLPTNFLLVPRNPGAEISLTSDDEWYKAAYYDAANHRYFDYPASRDEPMTCSLPTAEPNHANCGLVTAAANPANPGLRGVASWFWGDVTDVDAYPGALSPSGAYDMGGNLFQWTDTLTYAVTGQYHAGRHIAPVLDAAFSVTGNPFVDGVGPCAVVHGTDWGDGAEFNGANGRTCDISPDPFETYGIRLARRTG
jgi:formylglycine-generating enzyme required for sulfatase activity